MRDAFGDAVRLLRASLPGSMVVELQAECDAWVSLTAAEVHQIVLNLGTNARNVMPNGGHLRFRLTMEEDVDWRAATPRPDRLIRLEVCDDGPGMERHVADRIFEPFFTTDSDRGTGMGLATVHGIVTSAGGQIECRTRPGEGACFLIDLPAVDPPAPAGEPTPVLKRPEAGGERHLVVIDDEAGVRDVAARALRRQGYTVSTFGDPKAALRFLRSEPEVALVLSDLNMPGMNGLEVAARVGEGSSPVPVILMSGLVDEELQSRAAECGVHAVVSKPFRLDDLAHSIESAIAAGRPLPDPDAER